MSDSLLEELVFFIIMTRRQLWSVGTTLHCVHVPLRSATFVSSSTSLANLLYPCLSETSRKSCSCSYKLQLLGLWT